MCAILKQRAKLVQNIRSAVARKGTNCVCFFHAAFPLDLYFDQTLPRYMEKSLQLFRLFILQPTPELAKASRARTSVLQTQVHQQLWWPRRAAQPSPQVHSEATQLPSCSTPGTDRSSVPCQRIFPVSASRRFIQFLIGKQLRKTRYPHS